MEHLNLKTKPNTEFNLEALYQICPACFTEVRDETTGELSHVVDFDKLKAFLGEDVAEDIHESYEFTWVGKQEARREAAKPITKTLRPCVEESVDWDTTKNLYIEGDNLEVLKLLQNSYMGKVKMIYIDPPYNTGNDFIYHDDFTQDRSEYEFESLNINVDGYKYRKNINSNGRFHSDWCSMIYSRLLIARSFLREDGLILISINDNEIENLKKICNEIFGEKNFLYQLSVVNNLNGNDNSSGMMETQEYCLMYARNSDKTILGVLAVEDELHEWNKDEIGYWKVGRALKATGINAPKEARPNLFYPIFINKTTMEISLEAQNPLEWDCLYPITDGKEMSWSWSKDTLVRDKNEVIVKKTSDGYSLYKKQRPSLGDLPSKRGKTTFYSPKYATANSNAEIKKLFDGHKVFDYPKPVEFIKDLISISYCKGNDIILDFFSGSASTGHAVLVANALDGAEREFILVQLAENIDKESDVFKLGYHTISEIGKERIRRAGTKIKKDFGVKANSLDIGFRVFKCAESNMKDVYFEPKDLQQQDLINFMDNIKEDRTDLDLLFDCMLRWGVQLSVPIEKKLVGESTIYNVNDGDLVACFSEQVTREVIDQIADIEPLRVVFRDGSFEEVSEKMNLFEIFKQKCNWSDDEVRKNVRVI